MIKSINPRFLLNKQMLREDRMCRDLFFRRAMDQQTSTREICEQTTQVVVNLSKEKVEHRHWLLHLCSCSRSLSQLEEIHKDSSSSLRSIHLLHSRLVTFSAVTPEATRWAQTSKIIFQATRQI